MKIVTVLGARPQFIKAATLTREIGLRDDVQEVIVHTGQHYDNNMSDVFFSEMNIPMPHYKLGIGGASHGAMTGQMLEKIEGILLIEQPDWVLVYGDTNSTLAGALAAAKLGIKVAHVEAGLRSFNMGMPEEINRILTDRISDLLLCPTVAAMNNLENEGVKTWQGEASLSGDVMQDGADYYKSKAVKPDVESGEDYVLATIHRAENTNDADRLESIIRGLNEVSSSVKVILPLHPRTKDRIEELRLRLSHNIEVIEPVGYLNMVWLIDNCKLVLTDSGGLQKEAFFFRKHCITFRDETEWVELVENNLNVLVGADAKTIVHAFMHHKFSLDFDLDLYGKGLARQNILNSLLQASRQL